MPQTGPYFRLLLRQRDWKDRVDLQRIAHVTDGAGGNLAVVQTLTRQIPCVVTPAALSESQSQNRQAVEATHALVFQADPRLRNGDRLLWKKRLLVVIGWNDEHGLGLIFSAKAKEIVA